MTGRRGTLRTGRLGRAAAIAALATAVFGAADAGASSVSVSGSTLVYTAAPGEANRLTLSPANVNGNGSWICVPVVSPYGQYCNWQPPPGGRDIGAVRVDDAGATISPGAGCQAITPTEALCTNSDREMAAATVALGDRADTYAPTPLRSTVSGGSGDDDLREVADAGGDSCDQLSGDDGNDVLAGPCTLDGGAGADQIVGGAVYYGARTTAVTVTLDGLANDGATGEQDNVEQLAGSELRITGGAGADTLNLSGYYAGSFGAVLAGGSGNDRLIGGSSNDYLRGDAGDDVLDGGSGSDLLFGEGGRDELRSRDGIGDTDACGADGDTVFADSVDSIASDCERRYLG